MGTFSLIWGICAILGMMLAMIPLLGWLNWFNIPFAILGLIVSAIGMSGARRRIGAMPDCHRAGRHPPDARWFHSVIKIPA